MVLNVWKIDKKYYNNVLYKISLQNVFLRVMDALMTLSPKKENLKSCLTYVM